MNTNRRTITMEQQHINAATNLRYEDPFTNDQRDILCFTLGNKEYRRFIIGFSRLPHNVIFNSNVRQQEVDETYCREELIPKIKKDGLRCPIFVVQNGQSYTLYYPRMFARYYLVVSMDRSSMVIIYGKFP